MEEKKIFTEKPVLVAGVTIIVITENSYKCDPTAPGIRFLVTKRPVAIISISSQAIKAFYASGEDYPLDKLVEEIPDARKILSKYQNSDSEI
jgi:hypothetical protein